MLVSDDVCKQVVTPGGVQKGQVHYGKVVRAGKMILFMTR